MVIIHNRDENEIADIEVFVPVEKTELVDTIYKKRFEGGTFLRTTYNGIRHKGNAYAKLYDFAKQNNYKLIEPVIEKYEMKSGKFIIDIMFKFEKEGKKILWYDWNTLWDIIMSINKEQLKMHIQKQLILTIRNSTIGV